MEKITSFRYLGIIILSLFIYGCGESPQSAHAGNFSKEIRDNADLDFIAETIAGPDLLLLGESTHGTQEFYSIRSYLSRRLISDHGYDFIAVEGDWNSIYRLNLYVKGISEYSSAREVLNTFDRWPVWMWSNEEIRLLAEWLKSYNDPLPFEDRIGIYGFDVYDAESSLAAVERISGLSYRCLSMFRDDLSGYAGFIRSGFKSCDEEAKQIFDEIKHGDYGVSEKEQFALEQNALVVKMAERHYRAMVDHRMSSWNERVIHMHRTIERLSEGKRGIIWAHNTHVGDARATDMAQQGSINMGQLFRESGKDIHIVGFGTYRGEVIAGRAWGQDREVMEVPSAHRSSHEYAMQELGMHMIWIDLKHPELPEALIQQKGNRAIGVTYAPEHEYPGNYVRTSLAERYDSFIFINETTALVII